MNHNIENVLAGFLGFTGGMVTMLLQIQTDHPFFVQLFKAGFVSFVCGAAGIAGKYAFNKGKDLLYKRKLKKNSKPK